MLKVNNGKACNANINQNIALVVLIFTFKKLDTVKSQWFFYRKEASCAAITVNILCSWPDYRRERGDHTRQWQNEETRSRVTEHDALTGTAVTLLDLKNSKLEKIYETFFEVLNISSTGLCSAREEKEPEWVLLSSQVLRDSSREVSQREQSIVIALRNQIKIKKV